MMQVYTITNQKGGVGKTTSALAIAAILAERQQRVLVCDLDPQASLTLSCGYEPEDIQWSLYHAMMHQKSLSKALLQKIIKTTCCEKLYLLPSSKALALIEKKARTSKGLGWLLLRILNQLESYFDFVILDSPPHFGLLMLNALVASDQVVIPTQTEYLSYRALENMLMSITMVNKARTQPLNYCILPTLFDRRTRVCKEILALLKQQYGDKLCDIAIPIDTKVREASAYNIPLSVYQKDSPAKLAYQFVCDALVAKKKPSTELLA